MKKVYIVLSDTGSFFTKTIKLFTRQPYNHASISFNEDLHPLYSFGRKKASNPFVGGFVEERIHEGTFAKFSNTSCLVLSLKIDDRNYEILKKAIQEFIDKKEMYHYNLLGVMTALFNRPLPRKNKYFCSSFVAEVLLESGLDLTSITTHPHLTRPYDFLNLKDTQVEYEGLLKMYPKKR